MKQKSVLPGFGLTFGYTLAVLGILVLLPLTALVVKATDLSFAEFIAAAWNPRTIAAYKVTFGCALVAALLNVVFGLLVAWVLTRYTFPGRRLFDAIVDLPFALPTAVAGVALTTLYAPNGWLGSLFEKAGVSVAFTKLGIIIALTFVGFPFVVRTVQPVLEDLSRELEEAASSLGASAWQTFRRVHFPQLFPALLTGAALAFARAVGEYGSVIFISGNMPMKTEIAPLLVVVKLEQYQYAEAVAIACVLLFISFVSLVAINRLELWVGHRAQELP